MGNFWSVDDVIGTSEGTTPTRHDLNRYGGLFETMRGSHIRTIRDTSGASDRLQLIKADELVTDDGCRYSNLQTTLTVPLTLNFASGGTGLGQIDTGSRTVSKWYDIYAIGKRATKLVADVKLIAHRSPEYVVDQSQTTDDSNEKLRQGATDRVKLAQGFKMATEQLVYIVVKMLRVGTPTGNFWFTIESDNAGSPSGTILNLSEIMDVASVGTGSAGTGAEIFVVPFYTPWTAAGASTQYHLVLNSDYGVSASNYLRWQGVAAGGYANGSAKKYDGTNWAAATPGDFYFKLVKLTTNGTITYPTGYDQKCKLLPVYNNAANALVPTSGFDRHVRFGYQSIVATSTVVNPTLFDASGILPPGRLDVDLAVAGSVSGDLIEIDSVPDGILLGMGRVFGTTGVNAAALANVQSLALDYQSLYAYRFSGTGNFDVRVTGYTW